MKQATAYKENERELEDKADQLAQNEALLNQANMDKDKLAKEAIVSANKLADSHCMVVTHQLLFVKMMYWHA